MRLELLFIEDALEIHAMQLARDGNKRTGLPGALVFLDLNGIEMDRNSEAVYDLTMAVAQGSADKAEVAVTLEKIAYLH